MYSCSDKEENINIGADKKIEVDSINLDPNLFKNPQFFGPSECGCEHCQFKSYTGRVGLYEVLTMSEGLKKGIMDGVPAYELQKIAQKEGMVSLEQDGLIKVMQGITSLEEIYKLVKNS